MSKEELSLIDPSTTTCISLDVGVSYTGIATWDRGSFVSVSQIDSDTRDMALRPVDVATRIFSAINATALNGNQFCLIFEDYAYGSGFFNVFQAETVGIMKYLGDKCDMVFIPPSTIKKCVANNGRATKSAVKKAVKSLGYSIKSSHEADAIAVYLTYQSIWSRPTEAMFRRAILH